MKHKSAWLRIPAARLALRLDVNVVDVDVRLRLGRRRHCKRTRRVRRCTRRSSLATTAAAVPQAHSTQQHMHAMMAIWTRKAKMTYATELWTATRATSHASRPLDSLDPECAVDVDQPDRVDGRQQRNCALFRRQVRQMRALTREPPQGEHVEGEKRHSGKRLR